MLGRLADLLGEKGPLVITSLWPEHWAAYIAAAHTETGATDPAGTVGRLLERLPELTGCDPAEIEPARGGVIDVPDQFTPAEMETAALTGDSALAAAAAAAASAGQDGRVTQYLAGVPALLDRYAGHGGNPYGQAVIAAAMDASMLGCASPMPAAFLQEAAIGYLTGPQRTKDLASWCDAALAWATEELKGTVRALHPVPSVSGTGVAGYRVADYLLQHATLERRSARVPVSTWDAILSHVLDPADAARLADSAIDHKLHHYAIPLYRRAADGGDVRAASRLADVLAEQGELDELRARAAADDREYESPVIRSYSRPVSPPDDGHVCGLVAVDIVSFTRPDRTEDVQFYLRRSLYDYVRGALEAVGIPWDACYHEDRGDGVLLVLPADVSPSAIAEPMAERLRILLRRQKRVVSEAATMQLRVAIHAGPVSYDGYGIVGTDVNFLFRMLEARELKRLLGSSGAGLALIVSETVHRDLVTGAPDMTGGDPFRQVRFQVRHTKAQAWICLPGQVW